MPRRVGVPAADRIVGPRRSVRHGVAGLDNGRRREGQFVGPGERLAGENVRMAALDEADARIGVLAGDGVVGPGERRAGKVVNRPRLDMGDARIGVLRGNVERAGNAQNGRRAEDAPGSRGDGRRVRRQLRRLRRGRGRINPGLILAEADAAFHLRGRRGAAVVPKVPLCGWSLVMTTQLPTVLPLTEA